jgi:hypothetical protein
MRIHAPSRGSAIRIAAIGVVAGSGLIIASSTGVFAALTSTVNNLTPQTAGTGTMALTMANSGVGFSQNISNLAPGDIVNRYIDLTNAGTLDAINPALGIAATGTASLITNGTGGSTNKALTVEVKSCVAAWTVATGVCVDAGGGKTEVAATPLSTFSSAQAFVTTAFTSAALTHLRIQIVLPDQAEVTSNGTRPAYTVQGGSASLTYTFQDQQRTGVTTSS